MLVRCELDVGSGQNACKDFVFVEDGESAERVALHTLACDDVLKSVRRMKHNRISDQSVQVVLDHSDLPGLLLAGEILVNNADSAEHGHRRCHAMFGNRVHGGADKGHPQRDVTTQPGGDVGGIGQEIRMLGHK